MTILSGRAWWTFAILLLTASFGTGASQGPHEDLPPEEIIRRFSEKESEFREVWKNYTYKQKIVFQVLSGSGRVREQQEMEIEAYFTRDGRRETRVLSNRGRLVSVGLTKEDLSDATALQPFVLTAEELPDYEVSYVGKETVDELDTYVFDVQPTRQKKGQRYFQGRIWVDDLDFQIVMTRGKAVPDYRNNKFPEFETVREQIDGSYWFPTWTKADDVLRFGSVLTGRRDVHVRQLITYSDFRKFEVDTSISYETPDVP